MSVAIQFRIPPVVKVRGAAFPIKLESLDSAKPCFLSVYTVAPSLCTKFSCHLFFFMIHVSLPPKYGAETGACHFNLACDAHHEVQLLMSPADTLQQAQCL
jgi:hypothetical protein